MSKSNATTKDQYSKGIQENSALSDWRLLKLKVDLSHFNKQYIEPKKVKNAWIYYLVDFNLNVYICSLTPVKELWAMFSEVEFEENAPDDEGEFELELIRLEDNGGVDYYNTNVCENPNIPATNYMDIPELELGETSMAWRFRVAEESREVLAGNPKYF